jgi:hypothetical protein
MQRDLGYFAQRAREEREAAGKASCARSRAVHEDLARRYEDVLRAYEASEEAA